MRALFDSERGATAILVAGALVFLFGAAALAVDTSMFYGDARNDQKTADLSCLAGVREDTDSDRIAMAAAFTRQNWPAMSGETLTMLGATTGTITDGTNQVFFEASYEADPNRMRVVVTDVADTTFARALGANTVNIVQEAICERTFSQNGAGALPIGIVPGGFDGGIFNPNPCGSNSGNCGGLAIGGNGANTFADNIANGIQKSLSKHHGHAGTADPDSGLVATDCDLVGNGADCNLISTKTGQMAGPLGTGFVDRFKNDPNATCTFVEAGEILNCDTPAQVIGGGGPVSLYGVFGATPPPWWETSIYGPWSAADTASHYWHDGVVAKCDSPRRSLVPVVDDDDNWDIGSPASAWPNGVNSHVKVIALVDIIVVHPNSGADFLGNGNAKQVTADIIWYGPNAV
ncbi:MAG TPA: pilus assembly protein TadG-related protein, partial [Acidimicrobiia bacterium]|nr:pilus assembly protein TadG-related protein [Acidimicrobiia bacterium]